MEPGDGGGEGFDFHGRWNYKCLEREGEWGGEVFSSWIPVAP